MSAHTTTTGDTSTLMVIPRVSGAWPIGTFNSLGGSLGAAVETPTANSLFDRIRRRGLALLKESGVAYLGDSAKGIAHLQEGDRWGWVKVPLETTEAHLPGRAPKSGGYCLRVSYQDGTGRPAAPVATVGVRPDGTLIFAPGCPQEVERHLLQAEVETLAHAVGPTEIRNTISRWAKRRRVVLTGGGKVAIFAGHQDQEAKDLQEFLGLIGVRVTRFHVSTHAVRADVADHLRDLIETSTEGLRARIEAKVAVIDEQRSRAWNGDALPEETELAELRLLLTEYHQAYSLEAESHAALQASLSDLESKAGTLSAMGRGNDGVREVCEEMLRSLQVSTDTELDPEWVSAQVAARAGGVAQPEPEDEPEDEPEAAAPPADLDALDALLYQIGDLS